AIELRRNAKLPIPRPSTCGCQLKIRDELERRRGKSDPGRAHPKLAVGPARPCKNRSRLIHSRIARPGVPFHVLKLAANAGGRVRHKYKVVVRIPPQAIRLLARVAVGKLISKWIVVPG